MTNSNFKKIVSLPQHTINVGSSKDRVFLSTLMGAGFAVFAVILKQLMNTSEPSFSHTSPVLRLATNGGECTTFKADPKSPFAQKLPKEYSYFLTAGHCCFGEVTIANTLRATRIAFDSKPDWCLLRTEPTNGPGLFVADTVTLGPERAFKLKLHLPKYELPIFYNHSFSFDGYSKFAFSQHPGKPGDSGAPLVEYLPTYRSYLRSPIGPETWVIGIQSQASDSVVAFCPTTRILKAPVDNRESHVQYDDGSKESFSNWKQNPDGSQAADTRTVDYRDGSKESYFNWKDPRGPSCNAPS